MYEMSSWEVGALQGEGEEEGRREDLERGSGGRSMFLSSIQSQRKFLFLMVFSWFFPLFFFNWVVVFDGVGVARSGRVGVGGGGYVLRAARSWVWLRWGWRVWLYEFHSITH